MLNIQRRGAGAHPEASRDEEPGDQVDEHQAHQAAKRGQTNLMNFGVPG